MPIAIERYAGPLFMSHGTKDVIWPSSNTAALVAKRRAAQRDVFVHYLDGEGHVPSAAAWAKVAEARLSFFQRTLHSWPS